MSILSLHTLHFTDTTLVVSLVEMKGTALLSSQPIAIMLCARFTTERIVPHGNVLTSDGV